MHFYLLILVYSKQSGMTGSWLLRVKKNGSNSSMLKSVAIKRRESYFVVLQVSLHWHLPSKLLCVHYMKRRSSLLLAKRQMTDSSTSQPISLLLWIALKKATGQRPWNQHLFLGTKFLKPGYKLKACDLTTSVVLFTIPSSLIKEVTRMEVMCSTSRVLPKY